jgi:uncharacterized protein (TIGR02391 family)
MLTELLNKPDQLLSLAPEELARFLLAEIVQRDATNDRQLHHRHNFFVWLHNEVSSRHIAQGDKVERAFAEAWSWLQTANLIVAEPGQGPDLIFITKRGQEAASPEGFAAFRNSNLLPKETLHPALIEVWPTFIRGDYDTAVFQAFREVEIAVRKASKLAPTDIGVNLMRKAFGRAGPLEDPHAPDAERDGVVALFVGGVATYKNPQSHRDVDLSDPHEAAEIIGFSSQLLRIVDRRRTPRQ